mmetsp:Transcript_54104/g.157947  ORF Transcript_54104/g.157947 Transcript_54104/m.157947 type:complete len:278 (-) Transcript_54104:865-1698(-)
MQGNLADFALLLQLFQRQELPNDHLFENVQDVLPFEPRLLRAEAVARVLVREILSFAGLQLRDVRGHAHRGDGAEALDRNPFLLKGVFVDLHPHVDLEEVHKLREELLLVVAALRDDLCNGDAGGRALLLDLLQREVLPGQHGLHHPELLLAVDALAVEVHLAEDGLELLVVGALVGLVDGDHLTDDVEVADALRLVAPAVPQLPPLGHEQLFRELLFQLAAVPALLRLRLVPLALLPELVHWQFLPAAKKLRQLDQLRPFYASLPRQVHALVPFLQ